MKVVSSTGLLQCRPTARISFCPRTCPPKRTVRRVCVKATADETAGSNRREVLLNGLNVGVLASLFTFGAAPRPNVLGVKDYSGFKTLGLCPSTNNCVSTAEEANDISHFIPPWTYNSEESKRKGVRKSQSEAMQELVDVVTSIKPDHFEPKIITKTNDYLYAEFSSPTFGFVDDVEFFFPGNDKVEYRSASRIGESDGNINRKRIKALRQALEKKGWESIGF
ncbi:hypothetical protein WJX75_007987 [Coccomyxa subellipsoidea]|uniref:Uncharacterized protein n=1 Tax=Coccomyxa subellipsoidea TaxID=248742 RepID=A0ABR2YXI1_9CHLO